ncbi:MAG: hypothetical protein PHV06_11790, partial [bacterium]|nr:hypothetical protein [bacterium]
DPRMYFPIIIVILTGLLFVIMGIWVFKRIFGPLKINQVTRNITIGNMYLFNKTLELERLQLIKYSIKPYGKNQKPTPTVSLVSAEGKEFNVFMDYDVQLAKDFAAEFSEITGKPLTGID